jgi:1,4-alpha-glucan branching enzyme
VAPKASSLTVRVNGADHTLERADDGFWRGAAGARHGDDYVFVVDGSELADPASRWQPEGVRGPSRVLDTGRFDWSAAGGPGVRLDELVLYELHVGTFSDEGTFDAAIAHLCGVSELGVTAIEVMPVATFPGNRGWGYDGLYRSRRTRVRRARGLRALRRRGARDGLGVVLDVVYNHVGPGAKVLSSFGPYFTDRHETFWGPALDYEQHAVREWAIQNAELWVRDYKVDGLRLDAVHAVLDDGPTHVLAELAERVRAINPRVLVISEMATGDLRPIEEWGHDAQWADQLHHELHVLLTGERDGTTPTTGRSKVWRPSCAASRRSGSSSSRRTTTRSATARSGIVRHATSCGSVRQSSCSRRRRRQALPGRGVRRERRPFPVLHRTTSTPSLAAGRRGQGRRREFAGFAGFSGGRRAGPAGPRDSSRAVEARRVLAADEELRGGSTAS